MDTLGPLILIFSFLGMIIFAIIVSKKQKNQKENKNSKRLLITFTTIFLLTILYAKLTDPGDPSLAVTLDGGEKYSNSTEFDTNKKGKAIIKGKVDKNVQVFLDPDYSNDKRLKTTSDSNGNFKFQVALSKKSSLKEFKLYAMSEDKKGKAIPIQVFNTSDKYEKYSKEREIKQSASKTAHSSTTENSATNQSTSAKPSAGTSINQSIADHLTEDRGFATGTLDENGNPTQNGTPNPDFNWSLTIDNIAYTGKYLVIDVNENFMNFDKASGTSALNRAQNAAYSQIGIEKDWDMNKYVDGLYTQVNYQGHIIATTKIANNKEFKWK